MKLKGLSLLLIAVFTDRLRRVRAIDTRSLCPPSSLDSNTGNGGGTSSPAGLPAAGGSGFGNGGSRTGSPDRFRVGRQYHRSGRGGGRYRSARPGAGAVGRQRKAGRGGGSGRFGTTVCSAGSSRRSTITPIGTAPPRSCGWRTRKRRWMTLRNGAAGSSTAMDRRAISKPAQADLILAKDALDTAQNNYSGFDGKSETDINRAAALSSPGGCAQRPTTMPWRT